MLEVDRLSCLLFSRSMACREDSAWVARRLEVEGEAALSIIRFRGDFSGVARRIAPLLSRTVTDIGWIVLAKGLERLADGRARGRSFFVGDLLPNTGVGAPRSLLRTSASISCDEIGILRVGSLEPDLFIVLLSATTTLSSSSVSICP